MRRARAAAKAGHRTRVRTTPGERELALVPPATAAQLAAELHAQSGRNGNSSNGSPLWDEPAF
jgi:hypothetical protein